MGFFSVLHRKLTWKKLCLLVIVCFLVGAWLILTPPGLLGKADAIGFAVCHRIEERSFSFGNRPMPLCARCTGMYIGALIGLCYQLRLGRRGGMPSLKIIIVLGIFLIAFGIDGVNSYLHFFPSAPSFYSPQNYLRLLTGLGLGIGMAAMIYPVFQQTVWTEWSGETALKSWRQLGEIIFIAGAIYLGILSENPIVIYLCSLLSAATVVVILGIVYTMVWIMIFKLDNKFSKWKEMWMFIVAGFGTAIFQIAVMDITRFALSGNWNGFNLFI